MFDKAVIYVNSGKGGDGIVSFRREKYVPAGGPDGGDGGKGGDVILKVDTNADSLKQYYYRREYRAKDGGQGGPGRRHGKNGASLCLSVPPGTVVTDVSSEAGEFFLVDMDEEGQQFVVATGGKGGKGNIHFASSTNQAPRLASRGQAGEGKRLLLELKLIADVGIIGLPNAGKSSLLTATSAARPRVASYPFTTLEPELGTVGRQKTTFVMADIPGLIEGASSGKGLGYQFLRHIVRTRLLLHLIDGLSSDPIADFNMVNEELSLYDPELAGKNQVVAVNKLDLPEVANTRTSTAQKFAAMGKEARFISALTGSGVDELMDELAGRLERLPKAREATKNRQAVKIFRPEPVRRGPEIARDAEGFTVSDPGLERVAAGSDTSDPEVRRQLWKLLERKQGLKALEIAGAQPGDRVKLGNFEWRW